MTGQTNDFLTIEDAVKLTGTSESTVRRFVRSLDADQRKKHVRKEGRRVLIAKALLCDAFGVVPGMEDQDAANDLVTFQRQQLQDAVRIQSKLTEQNDRLLTELQKTNDDLKSAWSLIDHLKGEVFKLTTEIKRLEAPKKEDQRLFAVAVVVCAVTILVLLLRLV